MTTIDSLDVRSTWQRQLERPSIIGRKIDRLRVHRLDPETGVRVPWQNRHMHLTTEQQAAVRLGARRAYWALAPHAVPSHWQEAGRTTSVAEQRALEYGNNHLTDVADSWRKGGANYLARHIRLRMQEAMVREGSRQVDSNGNAAKVMPWGVWEDLEASWFRGSMDPARAKTVDDDGVWAVDTFDRKRPHQRRDGLEPLEGVTEQEIERARRRRPARNYGARAVRRVPAEVREQLAEAFDPGDVRHQGRSATRHPGRAVILPGDPTGETVAHRIWLDQVLTALASGMLPARGDGEPPMLTYRGRPLDGGRLPNGDSLLEIALSTITEP